jgi:hypothetical protein
LAEKKNKSELYLYKAAFEAGRLKGHAEGWCDAENDLKEKINFIVRLNSALVEEILRLDKVQPVSAVMMPYKYALKIADLLKRMGKEKYSQTLIHYINISNPIDVKQVLEILEEMKK